MTESEIEHIKSKGGRNNEHLFEPKRDNPRGFQAGIR